MNTRRFRFGVRHRIEIHLQGRCAYRAGINGIHPNTALGKFRRRRARGGQHPPFCRTVGNLQGFTAHAGERGNINDRPAPGSQHGGYLVFHSQPDAFQGYVLRQLPALFLKLGERRKAPAQRSIVNRTVQRAKVFNAIVNSLALLGLFRHIGVDRQRLAARLTNQCHGLLSALTVVVQHRHSRAIGREGQRTGAANAAARAGNQGDFILQQHCPPPQTAFREAAVQKSPPGDDAPVPHRPPPASE